MKRLGFLFVLLSSLYLAAAQPAGQVVFYFDRTTIPVWDFSGPYQLDQPLEGAGDSVTDTSYSINISQSNSGKLTGAGTTILAIGDDYVAADYDVSGSVKTSQGFARATFTVRLQGQDVIKGQVRKFNFSFKYSVDIDYETLELVGTVKGNGSIQGIGSTSANSDFVTPLPPGVDGSWYVYMDILALSSLGGTGSINVASFVPNDNPPGMPVARSLPADLKGSYSSSTDLSKVNLKGINEGKGTKLSLKFYTGAGAPANMDGQVLGQKVKL
jgi:hypothetical protein